MKRLYWVPLATTLISAAAAAAIDSRQQGDTTMSWVLLVLACFIYFAPSINAKLRKHPRPAGIVCLNLLLGWTLIGWVLALVWSYSGPPPIKSGTGRAAKKFCAQCGGEIAQVGAFCSHCGSSLHARPTTSPRSRLSE